jgi:hypothetical protein
MDRNWGAGGRRFKSGHPDHLIEQSLDGSPLGEPFSLLAPFHWRDGNIDGNRMLIRLV